MRVPTTARPAQALLVTALLASGCSSTIAGSGSASSQVTPTPTATHSSSAHDGAPRTSASAPPTHSPADGSDLTACRDSDCEVLLDSTAEVVLDPRFGCERFAVSYVTPNQVTFDVDRSAMSDLRAYIKGTGYLSLANGMTITVERIDTSGAMLGFSPTTEDTTSDRGSGSEGLGLF